MIMLYKYDTIICTIQITLRVLPLQEKTPSARLGVRGCLTDALLDGPGDALLSSFLLIVVYY